MQGFSLLVCHFPSPSRPLSVSILVLGRFSIICHSRFMYSKECIFNLDFREIPTFSALRNWILHPLMRAGVIKPERRTPSGIFTSCRGTAHQSKTARSRNKLDIYLKSILEVSMSWYNAIKILWLLSMPTLAVQQDHLVNQLPALLTLPKDADNCFATVNSKWWCWLHLKGQLWGLISTLLACCLLSVQLWVDDAHPPMHKW